MYIEIINLKLNDLLERNISYETIYNNLLTKLYEYRPYVNLCSNYTIDEVANLTDLRKISRIYFNSDIISISNQIYKKEEFMFYARNYVSVNKIVKSNNEKIEKLKSQKIDYHLYYSVLKAFNRRIANAMIYEGYIFSPGDTFGKLLITKETSEELRVNIGASMKKKRQLIKEGKKPYSKEEEQEYIDKGLEYDGIKYFVYYPIEDFMVKWVRPIILRKWFPFIQEYIYKPAASKKYSYLSRMRDFIKEDRIRALMLYDREYERT